MADIDFGDNVRVLETPDTTSAAIAGKIGNVWGVTTPSVTGIQALGHRDQDLAYNVHFDDIGTDLWLAPHLVVFVDHAPGSVVAVAGVSRRWTRSPSGQWVEAPGGTPHRSLLERFLRFLHPSK